MSPMHIFSKLSNKKSKRFILLLVISLFILFIIYNAVFDDELYLYYKAKDEQITPPSEQTDRGYYILTEEEKENLSSKVSSGMNKNALGGYDVNLSQINKALQEIIGNLSDEWIKGNTNMTKEQIDFFRKSLPIAILVHIKNPYLFATTSLLQKIEESGWNFTTPTDKFDGSVSNNCFGIKAAGQTNEYWDGSFVTANTREGMDGQPIYIDAKFKKYKSLEDSFLEHSIFFENNPRYRGGEGNPHLLGLTGDKADYRNASDSVEQIKIIQNAGYSPGSEHKYIADVERTYKANDMKRFDDLADKVLKIIERDNSSKTYDGEWNPEKAGIFGEIGVNPDELSDARQALLMDAYSLIGLPYIFGGGYGVTTRGGYPSSKIGGLCEHTFKKITEFGSFTGCKLIESGKATLADGTDCTGLLNHVYIHALGVYVPPYTNDIYSSPNFERVGRSDGKPGDIINSIPSDEYQHGLLIVKNNGNGSYDCIEEPQSLINNDSAWGSCKIRKNYTPPTTREILRYKGVDSLKVVQSNFKRVSAKTNKDMEDMKKDTRFQNSNTELRNSLPFTPSKSKHVKIQVTFYCDDNTAMQGGKYSAESKLLAAYGEPVCAAPSDLPFGSYVIFDNPVSAELSFIPNKNMTTAQKFRVVDRGGAINRYSDNYYHIDLCMPGYTENYLLTHVIDGKRELSGTIYYP